MAEVKDYFTDAGTLDRQEFGNLFASSIHLHDDTACGRATLLQCLDTRYWPSPMTLGPGSGYYWPSLGGAMLQLEEWPHCGQCSPPGHRPRGPAAQ